MKRNVCYMLFATLFFSCNKLKDYLPGPDKQGVEFNKVYGGSKNDRASSIVRSFDGGYVVSGNTKSNDGDVIGYHGGEFASDELSGDAWVVKSDKAGRKLWQLAIGGSGGDESNAVVTTSDGGYVVAGATTSKDGGFSGNHGNSDALVVRLDKNGNIVWQKVLGGSGDEVIYTVTASYDGGFAVAGFTNSNDGDVSGLHGKGGFTDVWVVKLDKFGNKVWQQTYGGSRGEYASAIVTTPDGGFLIAGQTESKDGDVSFNHSSDGSYDAWVFEIDGNGNIKWQKTFGGSDYDYANAVTCASGGGFVIAGITYSNDGDVSNNHGQSDVWIAKIGSDHKIEWQKSLGGSATDQAYAIAATLDGNYVIAGVTYSNDGDVSGNHGGGDAWVVSLDKDGNKRWQKTKGGSGFDNASSILIRKEGGYVLAATTYSNDGDVSGNHGNADVWEVTLKDQ